jgi:hypothetical protein
MENKIGDFIIKQIEDKKTQRWIISSDDLFTLCGNMGIIDDDDLMINVVEHLEENEIDVNFHGQKSPGFYRRWNEIEKMILFKKIMDGTKTETQLMMEKVDSIKVPERPDWLNSYMDDEEVNDERIITGTTEKPNQRILDMITKELTERINNEPGITIEELQQEINNEMNINNGRNSVGNIRHVLGLI